MPAPPPELAARVLAAAEAAASDPRDDWAARLWASTTALATRPLPPGGVGDASQPARALATALELPPQSLAALASAMRSLPIRDRDASTLARQSQIERMLEETGG